MLAKSPFPKIAQIKRGARMNEVSNLERSVINYCMNEVFLMHLILFKSSIELFSIYFCSFFSISLNTMSPYYFNLSGVKIGLTICGEIASLIRKSEGLVNFGYGTFNIFSVYSLISETCPL